MGDAVQGEAAALVGEADPVRGQEAGLAAAEAMHLKVALAAIDADNASALGAQGHQLVQLEAFAAEVAASLEVAALAELPPEELRATGWA